MSGVYVIGDHTGILEEEGKLITLLNYSTLKKLNIFH